jgi:hypothetical protein
MEQKTLIEQPQKYLVCGTAEGSLKEPRWCLSRVEPRYVNSRGRRALFTAANNGGSRIHAISIGKERMAASVVARAATHAELSSLRWSRLPRTGGLRLR